MATNYIRNGLIYHDFERVDYDATPEFITLTRAEFITLASASQAGDDIDYAGDALEVIRALGLTKAEPFCYGRTGRYPELESTYEVRED